MAIIATFNHDWEAHIAQGVLKENDIPSWLDNEIFSSIYPIGFNSIGGINLMVPDEYAEQAQKLLENCEE